jgi:hypothetical protein
MHGQNTREINHSEEKHVEQDVKWSVVKEQTDASTIGDGKLGWRYISQIPLVIIPGMPKLKNRKQKEEGV